MPVIGWHTLEEYQAAKERVIKAAESVADYWASLQKQGIPAAAVGPGRELMASVDVLRSFYADRGLRDPGTPGQQEPDAEQAHGEAVHGGG